MLESSEDVEFLFDITKQIKEFYEGAVIFITRNDFSDGIFSALCSIRTALRQEDKGGIADSIVEFHLKWLRAILEVDKCVKDLLENDSRDKVYQAISFTIDAVGHRLKYFQKYMEKCRSDLSNENQANLQAELEIVEDMHREMTLALLEKLKCFKSYDNFEEFKDKLNEAARELLTWLDINYDGLVIKLSTYIHVPFKLTKSLQEIVDELLTDQSNPATVEMLNRLKAERTPITIGALVRSCIGHELEISKVLPKIDLLEDTIEAMKAQPITATVLALIHKKDYLQNRVAALESLKTTYESMQNVTEVKFKDDLEACPCPAFHQLKVFNHVLPLEYRERLVTELCVLWDTALFGKRTCQSMIAILSVGDMDKEFTDEHGTFHLDEHSRKIYKSEDGETLLQLNECGDLVPVVDDIDHIYFYDDCGRYYIDAITREKIYKAHGSDSEYKMGITGELLKIKEIKDGIEYYFDNCGRYYMNEKGKRIYREDGHLSEYESDELGNIVRIRSQMDIFQPCPDDAHVTEDFKYLKQTVGQALRVCVADVLLHQPADPIKYLSTALMKFRENVEVKDTRLREKEELDVEREIKIAEERAKRLALESMIHGGSEASYDSNLVMYNSMHPDAPVSVGGVSSK